MKYSIVHHPCSLSAVSAAVMLVTIGNDVAAFSTNSGTMRVSPSTIQRQQQHRSNPWMVVSSTTNGWSAPTCLYSGGSSPLEDQKETDDEISRLRTMAQKLRAEAAALEAERAEELAKAASAVFDKFDVNNDGVVSLEELKLGLEKNLKMELSESRVKMIMDEFDTSGTGNLDVQEMVSIDQFRNKLQQVVQEEKRLAKEAVLAAKKEQEMAKLEEAKMDFLNEREPTLNDKLLSILPYLFPLMDSLQFGRFLLVENSNNPLVELLAILYTIYRSIPFSGFVAFLALNFLSSNPGINRLVRFNMQQAIFLDIALFFPGLIGAVLGVIGSSAGLQLPQQFNELGPDLVFGGLLLAVLYSSVSSLLGITPNKIPIVSQAVEDRMPTVDMFDDQGRFIPRELRDKKDDDEKKNKD